MAIPKRIVQPPSDGGRLVLGRTLPSLLDEALRSNPNPRALNQRVGHAWEPTSTDSLHQQASDMARGLRAEGLERGDRVALFNESDVSFVIGDMACLMAGLVTVPIYLTESEGNVAHILEESGARALLCSTPALLRKVADLLGGSAVSFVALWREDDGDAVPTLPAGVRPLSYAAVRQAADRGPEAAALAAEVDALDLATILYTSGTTGAPKGVMLTHQNMSSNIIACFSALPTFRRGATEVVLSFLPLSHVFARTLQYGFLWYGSSVYFGEPSRVAEDLRNVRPTFFATVPRVLEKAFDRIGEVGAGLHGVKRALFDAAMTHGRSYDPERPPRGVASLRHALLDRLVYAKWRDALGGRVRTVIVGGAALRAELARCFSAAGLDVLQGYGLTETSPVMTFSRPEHNRPGTVGAAIAGTEYGLSEEGEILARGPHVMRGYYRQPELTDAVLDEDGWFHTGDLGSADEDGLLRVTGRIKYLFKLSTGKYVMPQPLEEGIEASPLVATCLVVGEGQKYCAALLFVEPGSLRAAASPASGARSDRTEQPAAEPSAATRSPAARPPAAQAPAALAELRRVVRDVNRSMPAWSSVKRFAVVTDELTMESGAVTPKLSVRRHKVLEAYDGLVQALYAAPRELSTAGVAYQEDGATRWLVGVEAAAATEPAASQP